MLNTLLTAIIILSFLGILVILFRKIPLLANLSETELDALNAKRGFLSKAVSVIKRKNLLNEEIKQPAKKIKKTSRIKHLLGSYFIQVFNFFKLAVVKIGHILKKTLKNLLVFVNKIMGFFSKKIKDLSLLFQKTTPASSDKKPEVVDQQPVTEKFDSKATEQELIDAFLKEKIENQNFQTDDFISAKSRIIQERISIADLEKPMQEEQELIDLIVKNPKNIIAYKALGLYYWKHKNHEDAKASLETAVKLGSKDKQVIKALEEIKIFENSQG